MSFVIAVDSGGTFCDCVVFDDSGRILRAKAPSTPPNFEEGVLDSVNEAAKRLKRPIREILADTVLFAHGTTVATNTLITRTGAKIALLTTKGHEDAILIGRTAQKVAGLTENEIINVARLTKARPLVPRTRIFGVDERVDRAGRVVVPLTEDRLVPIIERLKGLDIEAVAISFLWSFLNSDHEAALRERLANELPDKLITISSDLAPLIREYERTATTAMNAYLTPAVARYLDKMRSRLVDDGLTGPVAIMQSSGGLAGVEEVSGRAAALLVSGPAGGALGAQTLGNRLGFDRILTTDVGGTSFDVGVIVGGEPGYSDGPVIDKYPLALPVIDVASIGSGGGSIAWVESDTGVLRVGPQSAGARPGPACYDSGGLEPTVTDANLVLGRINPDYFLGGRLALSVDRARAAIEEKVATPLGLSVEEAAASIIEIVDSQMADLIRKVTIERGEDPQKFVVFSYGGAGGLHCAGYTAALGCQEIVVPSVAAVFSAFGIAGSDAKRVLEVSDPMRAPFDLARWRESFEKLAAEVSRQLQEQRLPIGEIKIDRYVHLLFRGQVHTVRVPVSLEDLQSDDRGASIVERFTDLYEARYGPGTAYTKAGVEANALSVEAVADLPKPEFSEESLGSPDPGEALKDNRPVFLHESGDFQDVAIYSAGKLRPGHRLAGPAIIEAEDTTLLVRSGQSLHVDGYRNMRVVLDSGRE